MGDCFADPSSLFEEFEKEPVSKFDSLSSKETPQNGENWDGDDDDKDFTCRKEEERRCVRANGGGEDEKARYYPQSIFKTPKQLVSEAPGIQLTFLNHPTLLKHRSEIERFFAHLFAREDDDEFEAANDGDRNDGDSQQLQGLPQPLPTSVNLAPAECPNRATSWWQTMGCLQLYPRFILDAHGQPLVQLTHELTVGWDIPPFERLIEKPIPLEEEEGLVPKGVRKGRCCFNCGEENHGIADCPLPKNMKEIARRKAEVRKQSNAPTLSGNKATLDVSVDPRYKSLKPGVIGEELKAAINCGDKKLPQYIYNMRHLGYPPGWLEEAKLTHSGLTIYEGSGDRLRSDGIRIEAGEMEVRNFEEAKEFQLAKLIGFPGFNVPAPEGYHDETRRFHARPFNRNQSLELMRDDFSRRNDDLKRRLGVEDDSSEDDAPPGEKRLKSTNNGNRAEEMDMSSEEEHQFRPPLPPGSPPPATPPAPLPTTTPPLTPKTPSSNSFSTPSRRRQQRASSSDWPASSGGSSQSEEEDSEGMTVEDELEEGEMSREEGEMTPSPPPVSIEVINLDLPSSPTTSADPVPSSSSSESSNIAINSNQAAPTSPGLDHPTAPAPPIAACPSTPKSPSFSLNSISMEHSTPIPCRFDISDFHDEVDDEVDDDKDDGRCGEDDDVAAETDDGADESLSTPRRRRAMFMESNPQANPTMPTPDQWAKNVSEHMDFENLPNTEGRYSKIKEIVEKRKKSAVAKR